IMEKRLVKEIDTGIKHMSIIEFLRKAVSGSIRGVNIVNGFEELAKIWNSPEVFASYMRRSLRSIMEQMMSGSCTVIFPVGDRTIIGEERPRLMETGLSLAKIFGANRLERIKNGHFYSTVNIP
ncbi:unnamed protein product, partial [marine sediment metagenome]